MNPSAATLTQPTLEAIVLRIADKAALPGQRARRRLAQALRQSLHTPVAGWQVLRVPASQAHEYDLIPPAQTKFSAAEGWSLSYALARLPDVQHAEPSFQVLQDAEPAAEAPPATELPLPAALPTFDSCADDRPPTQVDDQELDWNGQLVDIRCAWQLQPPPPPPGFPPGQRRGRGIRIGHPDSGYRHHPDLFDEPPGQPCRLNSRLERDFVDSGRRAEHPEGGHGLNTASVIMSSDLTGFVVGAAPEAELVPLRVTRPRLGLPAPVLFESGARHLRDAIRYAVHRAGCHVISISLGWFGNSSLHEAVREAVQKNVIVVAASGNYVPLVVWPAAYPEVIAVAGCDAQRRPWPGASTGPQVDVSGPAARVWVAGFTQSGLPAASQSNGTSFATATLAGIAALWLAFHGRAFLLDRYHNECTLNDVFRFLVRQTSDPFSTYAPSGYGSGIYNARRILATPLPTPADIALSRPAALPRRPDPLAPFQDAFPDLPHELLAERLAGLLQVDAAELDSRLAGVQDELLFHLTTHPALRTYLAAPPAAADSSPAEAAAAPPLEPAELSETLRSRLR
jgi:thermitase